MKKKKGSLKLQNYVLTHSGVPQKKRASAGIAILLKKDWKGRIHSYEFINESIIKLRCKIHRGYLTITGVYATEEGCLDDSVDFHEILQRVLNNINKNDYVVIAGDLNAKVSKTPVKDV
jgi:exonuclease III